MTIFRTCFGCKFHPGPCATRDEMKRCIKGLGITSLKFRCNVRQPRFKPGDAVWALTVGGRDHPDDIGEPWRAEFPAVVINNVTSKVLVYIRPGVLSRCEDGEFCPHNSTGFCKIPLSRLEPRDAARERVCLYCSQPESLGHPEGYICALPANMRKWIGEEEPQQSPPEVKAAITGADDDYNF